MLIEAETDDVRLAELRERLHALSARLDEAASSRREHSGYLTVHSPDAVQPEPTGSGRLVIGDSVVRSTRMADVHTQALIRAHGMQRKATIIAARLETVGQLRDLSAAELQQLHKSKYLPGVGLPWLRALHAALRAVGRLDPPRAPATVALAAPVPAPEETVEAEEETVEAEEETVEAEEETVEAEDTPAPMAPEAPAPASPVAPAAFVPTGPITLTGLVKRIRVPNPKYKK
jgi:hypothetical protein